MYECPSFATEKSEKKTLSNPDKNAQAGIKHYITVDFAVLKCINLKIKIQLLIFSVKKGPVFF